MENYLKKNTFYFDLELLNLLELCNQGAESVFQYLLQKGADEKQKLFLIIDEIQYMDDPTKFLKIMHDHYPNIKPIVSGSSTFEIKKKFKESLVGRTINFELYPLSFEEYLIFKNKNYKLNKENTKTINDELVELAEDYIRFGGYPKIVLEPSEEKKHAYLGQIISTYVRKDIRDIGNIRNVSAFNKLLELLAAQSGNLLNVLEISNTLKINRETVLEYLKKNPRGKTTTELGKELKISRKTIEKHLQLLVFENEIYVKQFGPTRVYYPNHRVHHFDFEKYYLKHYLNHYLYVFYKE